MKWTHRHHRARAATRGGALVGALFVVILVGAFSLCYLQLVLSHSRESTQFTDAKRAFYMAEAGIAESIHALTGGHTGSVGTSELPAAFGNGMYFVEVTDLPGGQRLLKSTGLCGTGRHTIELVVQPAGAEVASLGLFGGDRVTIDEDVTVRSIATTDGSPSEPAKLGSNGDIELGPNSTVDGDATPGIDGLVDLYEGASVTGSTAPRVDSVELPGVPAPEAGPVGELLETLVVLTGVPKSLPSGDYRFDVLGVADSGVLTLVGPMSVVTNTLALRNGASITVDDSLGKVTLLVEDTVDIGPATSIETTSGESSGLTILSPAGAGEETPPTFTFGAGGLLRGFVYAPNAELELQQSFRLLGSAIARVLTVKQDALLEIDPALAASAPLASLGGWDAMAWRVTELPDVPMVNLRMDPLLLMRVRGLEPPTGTDAYDLSDDAHLDVLYRKANWQDLEDWSEHFFDKKSKTATETAPATMGL